uniref:Rheacalcin-1-like n=2 Tax=Gouania willdenowi TaxID=441366 RepID=A0A8C5D9N2_GOUWI
FPTEEHVTQRSEEPSVDTEVEANATATSGNPDVFPQARFSSCLDDWLFDRGNCYFLVNNAQSWTSAERHCSDYDSSLVSITNQWEQSFIKRLLRTADYDFAWTGGFYFQREWRWEDGSFFSFYDFENMSHSSVHQCLSMASDAQSGWSGDDCTTRLPFVCKRKLFC